MGNVCSSCVCRQTDDDEAADALLDGFESTVSRPRGPPPPYQVEAPLYAMSEEQRVQLVQRVTMIQSLPLGRYDVGEDKTDKDGKLEPSDEVQGREKKGEEERECPICMNDFAVGEPIRLLPCMHFYHMRCIDNWLMRSYSCPSCMERVDVGMRHTLSSTMPTSPAPSQGGGGVRRRRRRGRGERGSSSSIASMLSVGMVGGAEGPSGGGKRHGVARNGEQFLPPEYDTQHSGHTVAVSGQAPGASGHRTRHHYHLQHPHHQGGSGYLTDHSTSTSGHVSSSGHHPHTTGHTGLGQADMASGGFDYEEEVQMLSDSGFVVRAESASCEDLAYSMNTMTYSDYRPPSSASSRGNDYFLPQSPTHPRSPPPPLGPPPPPGNDGSAVVGAVSSPNRGAAPFSPPVFEYHFEYPTISHAPSASSAVALPYNQ